MCCIWIEYRLRYYCDHWVLKHVVSRLIDVDEYRGCISSNYTESTKASTSCILKDRYISKNTTASHLDWYRLIIIDRTSEVKSELHLYDTNSDYKRVYLDCYRLKRTWWSNLLHTFIEEKRRNIMLFFYQAKCLILTITSFSSCINMQSTFIEIINLMKTINFNIEVTL